MKLGLIDYFLDNFHANKYPEWIKEASNNEITAAYAYAEIDSPRGGQTTDEWCKANNIKRVHSIEEIIALSDALIVLSPDHPERHEDLCQLPLRSGKCVYVDKTFAETKEIAKRIFAIARQHNTPCYSSSALRFASEYAGLGKNIKNIVSRGPGTLETYSIHQIEPVVALMGHDITQVMFTGTEKAPAYVLEYADGRKAHLSHHGWECPFGMVIDFDDNKSRIVTVESDFFRYFIRDLVDFFCTGSVKVPHDETITVIAVIEAAMKAAKVPFQWVAV